MRRTRRTRRRKQLNKTRYVLRMLYNFRNIPKFCPGLCLVIPLQLKAKFGNMLLGDSEDSDSDDQEEDMIMNEFKTVKKR